MGHLPTGDRAPESEAAGRLWPYPARPAKLRSKAVLQGRLPAIFLLVFLIGSASAGGAAQYVIELPDGRINWSTGQIIAVGSGSSGDRQTSDASDAEAAAYSIAMRNAGHNLFDILRQVRIDSRVRMEDLAARNPQLLVKAREMVYTSREVEELRRMDDAGTLTVFLQFQLHGGFSQLVLPREIVHVDSITKVIPGKNAPAETADPDAYTGLVVDARNIGTQPALVPKILDENGRDVYGPAFASREFAVQKGMSAYETDFDAAAGNPRIGDAPLIVKGLRTEGAGQCNIVIANAEAARIRKSSDHLLFLRQCRVVIVLDAPK